MAIKQNFTSREETILKLASAYGNDPIGDRVNMVQKYDSSTGTYYSQGKVYSRVVIEEAKSYMHKQAQKYANMGAEYRDLSLAYDLAYEAITRLTADSLSKVIKDSSEK